MCWYGNNKTWDKVYRIFPSIYTTCPIIYSVLNLKLTIEPVSAKKRIITEGIDLEAFDWKKLQEMLKKEKITSELILSIMLVKSDSGKPIPIQFSYQSSKDKEQKKLTILLSEDCDEDVTAKLAGALEKM